MSLKNRIADLQKNSHNWKDRVDKDHMTNPPTTGISTVKSLLTSSQSTWKDRVTQKDAHLFTVSGKLQRDDLTPVTEPDTQPPQPPVVVEEKQSFYLQHSYNPNDSNFSSFFPSTINNNATEAIEVDLDLDILTQTHNINSPQLFPRPRKPRRPKNTKSKKIATDPVLSALQSTCDYKIPLKTHTPTVDVIKKLYKIKGKKHPIPLEIPPKMSNLSNHDCFVLVTYQKIYCFYGDYANLLEKTKCDEFFFHYNKLRSCVRVFYKSSNWGPFLGEFDEIEELSSDDIGDEGDVRWESGIEVGSYRWDGAGWVLSGRSEGLVMQKFLEDNKPEGVLLDFGRELFHYIDPSNNKKSRNALAELTIPEILEIGKYLTFKKVKKNLEPIEFWSKFAKNSSGIKLHPVLATTLTTPTNTSTLYSDLNIEHSSTTESLLSLESISFPSLASVQTLLECDPRKISTQTNSLTKYKVTINSIIQSELLLFQTTSCYVIEWNYRLTYSTGRLQHLQSSSSSQPTITSGRPRTSWFCWYGDKSNPLDRGRLSALFSVTGDFEMVFGPGKSPEGEKVAIEEGCEPGAFLELFNGARFTKNETAVFEKIVWEGTKFFVEVPDGEDFYEDGEYFTFLNDTFIPFTGTNCKKRNLLKKVYKIIYAKSQLKIQEIVDFNISKLNKNFNYLLVGDLRNVLICSIDCYEARKNILFCIKNEDLIREDFFVVFSLEDYYYLNETNSEPDCFLGSFCVQFLENLKNGEMKLVRNFDFQVFKEFYPMGDVGSYLGEEVIQEKFEIDMEEFQQLPLWRQKLLTNGVFY